MRRCCRGRRKGVEAGGRACSRESRRRPSSLPDSIKPANGPGGSARPGWRVSAAEPTDLGDLFNPVGRGGRVVTCWPRHHYQAGRRFDRRILLGQTTVPGRPAWWTHRGQGATTPAAVGGVPIQSLVRTAPAGRCYGLHPPLSCELGSTISDGPAQRPSRLIRGRLTGPAQPAPKAEARGYPSVETHPGEGRGTARGRGPARRRVRLEPPRPTPHQAGFPPWRCWRAGLALRGIPGQAFDGGPDATFGSAAGGYGMTNP